MGWLLYNTYATAREIFLRELISNANDALEKLRLISLTNKAAWNGEDPLNITINAIKDEDGKGGRIIITGTYWAYDARYPGLIALKTMALACLLKILRPIWCVLWVSFAISFFDVPQQGTLAKSGTSDFLAKAENQEAVGTSNLIGAFGLGFYSSFLVADRVEVASIPAKSDKVSNPVQHVFSSGTEDSTFEVYPDPRGNTLDRGTEITLYLKNDSLEYLDQMTLEELVCDHIF